LAGGALLLAMHTEASAAIVIEPGADAELIAICTEYHRVHADWNEPPPVDDDLAEEF
jgi:hypothetical protein